MPVAFAHRWTAFLAASLLFGLLVPFSVAASSDRASAATTSVVPEPGVAAALLALTNQARTSAGLRPLGSSSALSSVAASWSAHMASSHQLGHNPNLASEVSGWAMIGENAAMAWSAAQAQSVLMGDAAHRANILQPRYNRVGVGVARASDGSMWFTVDFMQTAGYSAPSKPTPSPTHHAAPKPVVHATSARSWPLSNRTLTANRASRSLARGPVPGLATPARAPARSTALPQAAGRRTERTSAAGAAPTLAGLDLAGTGGGGRLTDLAWLVLLLSVTMLAPVGVAVTGPCSAWLRRTARPQRWRKL